jgi:hypothetical protein
MTRHRETTADRIAREDREFDAAEFAELDAIHDAHCRAEAIARGEFDAELGLRIHRLPQ